MGEDSEMNAYELAEIMTVHDGSQVWEHGLEIANMLRHQADYIAQLEKGLESSIALNKAQAERQAKELTDEEINELYIEHGNKDWAWQIDFARAILRKAQEK